MTMKQVQKDREGALLPSNILPGVFTNFCWDNNDLNEQTLSGSGTTHCTNGILIQRRVHTCQPPPHLSDPNDEKPVNQVPTRFLSLDQRQRYGPGLLNVDLSRCPNAGEIFKESRKLNAAWFLHRLLVASGDLFTVQLDIHEKMRQTITGEQIAIVWDNV